MIYFFKGGRGKGLEMPASLNLKLVWSSVVQAGVQLAVFLLQALRAGIIGECQHALFYIILLIEVRFHSIVIDYKTLWKIAIKQEPNSSNRNPPTPS